MYIIEPGATDQTIYIMLRDSTTGLAKTGLVYNSAGASCYYTRPRTAATQITLATLAAATSAHSDGGFKEVDATNAKGLYRLDLPDAAIAASADYVIISIEFDDTIEESLLIELNLASASDIVDEWKSQSQADPTGFHVNVKEINGTSQTANDNGADINDIQSRIPAALVSGRMSSDSVAVGGSSTAADNLALSAGVIITGTAQTGTLSTTQMTTNLSESTNDHYIGRIIIWTSGALLGQATDITDYVGVNGLLTFTAVTEAPSNGNTFIII